jgi:hypothetical protein
MAFLLLSLSLFVYVCMYSMVLWEGMDELDGHYITIYPVMAGYAEVKKGEGLFVCNNCVLCYVAFIRYLLYMKGSLCC